jgi:hypothetical protein
MFAADSVSIDTLIGLGSLIVGIIGLLLGARAVWVRRSSQKQDVSGSAIAIQSGRDTKISNGHDETESENG